MRGPAAPFHQGQFFSVDGVWGALSPSSGPCCGFSIWESWAGALAHSGALRKLLSRGVMGNSSSYRE